MHYDFTRTANMIILLSAAVAGITYLIVHAWQVGRRVTRAIAHASEKIDMVLEVSEFVKSELMPNGGYSIKDQLGRVERDVETLRIRLEHSPPSS